MVDTRVGLDFATGKAEENKKDGLPDQEMQSASRTEHRNAAMQASQRKSKTVDRVLRVHAIARQKSIDMNSNHTKDWRGMQFYKLIQKPRTNKAPKVVKRIFHASFLDVNVSAACPEN